MTLTTKAVLDGGGVPFNHLVVDDGTGKIALARPVLNAAGTALIDPATEQKQDALITVVGAVTASPAANTVLDRLKAIATNVASVASGLSTVGVTSSALPTGASTETTSAAILAKLPTSPALDASLGGATAAAAGDTGTSSTNGFLRYLRDSLYAGVKLANTAAVGIKVGGADVAVGNRVPVTDKPPLVNALITTLTRPANVTAYSAGDSISDNATAGSVTALSCTASDTNDDPIAISELLLDTTDTGLAAGISVRAWLYNSDPTASSGVGGGDNAAFSNKKAGFIGTLSGAFRAFSDGGKARLVPDEGTTIIANPSSGGRTIWVQYQTLGAFTPSANSTTLIGRLKGFQGRA